MYDAAPVELKTKVFDATEQAMFALINKRANARDDEKLRKEEMAKDRANEQSKKEEKEENKDANVEPKGKTLFK
jgi:hypothetical protein